MTRKVRAHSLPLVAGLSFVLIVSVGRVCGQATLSVPNLGQNLTPLGTVVSLNPGLAQNPTWTADHAVSSVVSPLGNTLLVMTSGYNRVFDNPLPTGIPLSAAFTPVDSTEHVFVYDLTTTTPNLKQVLTVANTYNGIVFDPSGLTFYVAGGASDNLHIFTLSASTGLWGEATGSPMPLGHAGVGLGINVLPCAAGVGVSTDGRTLVVANLGNDSITVFNRGSGFTNWSAGTELDLRPGKNNAVQSGVPGGEYPFWVVVKGTGSSATAYVSTIRDREIDVVSLGNKPAVLARIPVKGQPNKMTLNKAQSFLYVADDQADTVDVIDTSKNEVVESIPVIGLPPALAQLKYKGANPNSVTLSPDEAQLYVTDGNLNCVAVIALGGTNSNDQVVGLIPTGWYPNSVSLNWYPNTATYSAIDTVNMYVVTGKSPTGANPNWCYGANGPALPSHNCMVSNEFTPQLTKAGLASFPLPGSTQLVTLTAQVIANDGLTNTESASDSAVMAAVHKGVQHVIYILKENRTYDQILGDLTNGADGDPSLTEFGAAITPNEHNLARNFVTLDRFLASAEVSVDGWGWSTSAQVPDVTQRCGRQVTGYAASASTPRVRIAM